MSIWLDLLGAEIRFVETPSFGRIRIAEAGSHADEALFLLHGLGGHLEAYSKNLVPLSDRFHVVAYDHAGHGLSAKKPIEYTPQVLSEQLRELMDALAIRAAHLSGESLGGWVAGLFATRHPDRVLRLMLNTSAGLPIVSEKGRVDLEAVKELTRKASGASPTYESVRARVEWLFHPNNRGTIPEELIRLRLQLYQMPDAKEVASRIAAMLVIRDEDLIPLERLRCPTLFLWTESNPVHDLETAKVSARRVAGSRLYVMEGDAAHWPQYEASEEFNAVARRFFAAGGV